ncbi:hypothetical protein LI073_10080 [bacterium 210917-SL.2.15]|nr:hypothetical protein [bacterium 210917-SL.2.15]
MKSLYALLCTAALAAALSGSSDTDYSNSTLTGQVTTMDGTTVTLQLGKWTDGGSGASGNAAPDGESPAGKPTGQMPDGASFTASEEITAIDLAGASVTLEQGAGKTEGSLEDIESGDILVIEVGENNMVSTVTVKQNGLGGFGGSGQVTRGTAAHELTEDGAYSGISYSSVGDDENALRVTGAAVMLDGISADKSTGVSSNTEDGDFYGKNAALLATDGAQVTIRNASITSLAQNGNGVFGYGVGTAVTISNSTIAATADHSGGLQTTSGGTTNASNLTVTTSGDSSAAD